jgi:uncharacterized protein (TIRG00374 family)
MNVRRKVVWRGAAATLALGLAAFVLHTILGNGSELGRALDLASRPQPGFIVLAAACELISYLAYASAQRGLVRAAGHHLNLRWLASMAVTAQALNNFLPAGYLAANVFNFRQLRRADVPAPASGWVLLMTSILNIGALLALALIGSEITGGGGPAFADVRLAGLAVLALILTLLIVAPRLRQGDLRGLAGRQLAALEARMSQRSERAAGLARRARSGLAELAHVRLSRRAAASAAGRLAVCWLADAACLVSAFLAVGAHPPWSALLLAYCGAQLVAYLPLTPGGVGFVEGSLAVALTAGGVGAGHVLAAVLLYRVISYWATLPFGAIGYLSVRHTGFHSRSMGSLGWSWPSWLPPIFALRSSISR